MEINDLKFMASINITRADALVVVDMQNDFMPGGALAVSEGDTIIAGVNQMMQFFGGADLPVVMTQDWHPMGHHSFASVHEGRQPYDLFESAGIGPVLWPDHCIQGSWGAEFHRDMKTDYAHAVIRKGYHTAVDSYSAFIENDKVTETGLAGYLQGKGVRRVFLCGLALDYCVFFSAADASDKGFEVYCIVDLARPVASPAGSVSNALESMVNKNVKFIEASCVKKS